MLPCPFCEDTAKVSILQCGKGPSSRPDHALANVTQVVSIVPCTKSLPVRFPIRDVSLSLSLHTSLSKINKNAFKNKKRHDHAGTSILNSQPLEL